MVEVLLAHKASVNCQSPYFQAPLHCACNAENLEMVQMLLKYGANPNMQDRKGSTPLHVLVAKPETEQTLALMRLLQDYGADGKLRNARGQSPLVEAARLSRIQCFSVLMETTTSTKNVTYSEIHVVFYLVGFKFGELQESMGMIPIQHNDKESNKENTAAAAVPPLPVVV